MELLDPVVIIPVGFDCKAAWKDCHDEVDRCGGLVDEDGEPNMRAAFAADPGCCSCPKCWANYWAWGQVQQCIKCEFIYPTNAWPMYSYGMQRHRMRPDIAESLTELHKKRLSHPYYRFGFEHPVDDAWEHFHQINWGEIFKHGYNPCDRLTVREFEP